MPTWRPDAVISGGQTGADRGGLDAGIAAELKIGGWVPKGRRAEDGVVPELYPMTEHADRGYMPRTRANIQAADGTIIFCEAPTTGGSRFTESECVIQGKPHMVADLKLKDEVLVWSIREWLNIHTPRVVNVAGNRESRYAGIQARVKQILVAVFKG